MFANALTPWEWDQFTIFSIMKLTPTTSAPSHAWFGSANMIFFCANLDISLNANKTFLFVLLISEPALTPNNGGRLET